MWTTPNLCSLHSLVASSKFQGLNHRLWGSLPPSASFKRSRFEPERSSLCPGAHSLPPGHSHLVALIKPLGTTTIESLPRADLTCIWYMVQVLWSEWDSPGPAAEKWAQAGRWPEQGADLRPGNSARGAVEIHRGPLVFTFPVPGLVNTTVLNATTFGVIHQTKVTKDSNSSRPSLIALHDPNNTSTFKGFTHVPEVPFDRSMPPARISVKA